MKSVRSGSRLSARHFVFALSVILLSLSYVANAVAQDPSAVSAPTRALGDRWTWNVEVSRMDMCTEGIASGAQQIETVTSINDAGYVTEIVGPFANDRYSQTYSKDGSYKAILDGKELHSSPVAFPLRPGNKWETTLVSRLVVTSLECKADTPERMTVGSENLEVIPITCEGKWTHRQSGASNVASYKYWYSPIVGASVRRTVFTRWKGRNTCVDTDWRLESYTRSK